MAKTLGSVAVGSSVYLNVGGTRTEFLVVHQGLPSSLYDSSCDGTWLFQKVLTEQRAWNSERINDYKNSEIHAYLNSEYLYKFDPYIQKKIKSVKIPYINGVGNAGPIVTGADGLQAKLFLLSTVEVGYVTSGRGDGACLSYFQDTDTILSRRIAYTQSGTAMGWWTRTAPATSSSTIDIIKKDGYKTSTNTNTTYYPRPAFILPYDLVVDDSGNVTEPVAQILHGSMINNVLCVTKKCYAMINGVLCAVPYGLANVDGVMTKIQFEEPEPPAPPVQMYTVTIERNAGGLVASDVCYFKINGTTYTGSSAVTLTVNAGTAWEAYVNNNYVAGGYISYGGQTYTGVKTGTVTSNLKVRFDAQIYNNLPYAYIYITTS